MNRFFRAKKAGLWKRSIVVLILAILFSPGGFFVWFAVGTNYSMLKDSVGQKVIITDLSGRQRFGELSEIRLVPHDGYGFIGCRVVVSDLEPIPGTGSGMLSRTLSPWEMDEVRGESP